jgi:hypothetical protein
MGNSSSNAISINLERTNSLYFTGETVSGTVDLNITNEKVEADEIYIMLTGEIGYTTARTVFKNKRRSRSHKDHDITFYSTKFIFAQPQPGETELVLNHGQYSWSFQIPLTDDYLPPTMNQPQSYPHVRYYLQFVIDKPWYKPNIRENRYIMIYPRVNLLQNPQCLLSTIFGKQNRKEIILKGTLNKLGYVPGELIHILLEIENPRTVLIKHIDFSLFQSYQIGNNTRGNTIFQTTLPKILNLKDQQIRETFYLLIPSALIPPSYQFQGRSERFAFVNIHYFLRCEVKVEGMFTNFDVDIPITLGTEPNPNLNQQQTFNPLIVSYSLNPQESMFNDDVSAPSYDSVVQNVK